METMSLAKFRGRNVEGRVFENIKFSQSRLEKGWIRQTRLSNCQFIGCKFDAHSNVIDARIENCRFENTHIGWGGPIYLRTGAILQSCEFIDCFIHWTSIEQGGCGLSDILIRGGAINSLHLVNAQIENVRLETNIRQMTIVKSHGDDLDLSRSEVDDVAIDTKNITNIRLPPDSKDRFFTKSRLEETPAGKREISAILEDPNEIANFLNRKTIDIETKLINYDLTYIYPSITEDRLKAEKIFAIYRDLRDRNSRGDPLA